MLEKEIPRLCQQPPQSSRKAQTKKLVVETMSEIGPDVTGVEGSCYYNSPQDMAIGMVDSYVESGLSGGKSNESIAAAAVHGSLVMFGESPNIYRVANKVGCSAEGLKEMCRDMIGLVMVE